MVFICFAAVVMCGRLSSCQTLTDKVNCVTHVKTDINCLDAIFTKTQCDTKGIQIWLLYKYI